MKNIFFLFILLSPICLLAQADSPNGTSLEEYRFLTKGYAHQVSMGLDPHKDGYELKVVAVSTSEVDFIGLYKKRANRPQAMLLIVKSDSEDPTYICLPNNQAHNRVWDLYEMDRTAIKDPAIWESYDAAMRDLTFQLMGDFPTEDAAPEEYVEVVTKTTKTATQRYDDQTDQADRNEMTSKGGEVKQATKTKKSTSPKEINTDVNITVDQDLVNLGVIKAPVIRGNYGSRGIIVIKFCVEQDGTISNERYTMKGSTTYKESLKQMALQSIRESKFKKHEYMESCGIATFHFK